MMDTLIYNPMTNALLLIYSLVGQNFGLAIILFTVVIRFLTYPLTTSQMKSTAAMQEFQKSEKWLSIQKKYKDDREKLSQEQMKLYQEMGINPLASCLPTLIQLPIIIGLFRVISIAMAATPLQLIDFSNRIYPFFPNVASLLPLHSRFLWMDLSQPERLFIPGIPWGIPTLAIIVVITSYLQTKMMTPMSTGDDQSQAATRAMTTMMPLMIGMFAYTGQAGLAVYFVASNIVGIVQYALMGKLEWKNVFKSSKRVTNSPSITVKSKPAPNKKNGSSK